MHGFLLLRSPDGKLIAVGDQTNVPQGNQVRSRLVFHFRDGSVDDETTVFRQGSVFQVISDHHIQKGPSFPEPLDVSFDVSSGNVTSKVMKDGKLETKTDHVDLPPDLSNGIVSAIIESYPAGAPEMKVSYLASDPKPRVVALSIKPETEAKFDVGGLKRSAKLYTIHIEFGGISGAIAPMIGRQPTDYQIWVADGPVPAFIKLRGALYLKGPIWTVELTSPTWSPGT